MIYGACVRRDTEMGKDTDLSPLMCADLQLITEENG